MSDRVWSSQQQAIFHWLSQAPYALTATVQEQIAEALAPTIRRQHLVVRARAGCLAADTLLSLNRSGKGFQTTIDRMVGQINHQPSMM